MNEPCRIYGYEGDIVRCSHTGAYWQAAALLVECPYCNAPPFTNCVTLPVYRWTTRQPEGGGNPLVGHESHSGRFYEGHEVLTRLLTVAGFRKEATDDRPPLPNVTPEDVVAIVHAVLAQQKPRRTPRKATKKATTTRKRT